MTVVRIAEGMHDLVLSAAHVRKVALDEIGRFVDGYVQTAELLQTRRADRPERDRGMRLTRPMPRVRLVR